MSCSYLDLTNSSCNKNLRHAIIEGPAPDAPVVVPRTTASKQRRILLAPTKSRFRVVPYLWQLETPRTSRLKIRRSVLLVSAPGQQKLDLLVRYLSTLDDRHPPGHRPSSNMLDGPSWRQTTEPTGLGTVAPANLPFAVIRQGVDHRVHGAFRLGPRKKLTLSHLSVCVNDLERVIEGNARLEGKNKFVHRFDFERGQHCKNVLRSLGEFF